MKKKKREKGNMIFFALFMEIWRMDLMGIPKC